MSDQAKLYETLGELLYVVAKADGVIQDDERNKLDEILKGHAWATDIKWSFDYEESKENSIEEVYEKVISVCHRIGPSPVYEEFIESMNTIANSDNHVDDNESKVINGFSKDLIERFKRDIDKMRS